MTTMNSAAAAFSAPAAAPAASAPAAAPNAPPPQGAPAVEAPAAAAPAPSGDWYAGIADETTRTWAQAKGWKDPAAVVESAFNLEKLIGHEKAGRTVVIPGEDAKPEELAAFRTKMGVPEKADGYKLPVPEGQDPALATEAANWMHEAGIPPKQAEQLAGKWNEYMAKQQGVMTEQAAKQADMEFGKVVASWGKDADANLELGKRAAAQFVPAANAEERASFIAKIETAIGTENMLKMFANIGKGMGEHKMAGDGNADGFGTSAAQAQAKIAQLKADKTWVSSYIGGDKAKKDEMERLTKLAYPAPSAS